MADQSERSLVQIPAMVMIYDNNQKEWMFAGVSEGNSKVQIFHHPVNNTFRVVARKLLDHEIVINCGVLKTTKYNRATETFHQWRDRQNVYGLSFMSPEDASTFGLSMENVLLSLSNATPAPQTPAQHLFAKPSNDNNNEDDRNLYSRAQPQGIQTLNKPFGPPPLRPPSQAPPSAPPLAKAPSVVPVTPAPPPFPGVPAPPTGGPSPPSTGGAPPPPPPPPPPSGGPVASVSSSASSEDSGAPMGDLAAAIAGAKLKKMNRPVENGSSASAGSSNSGQSSKVMPAMDMMSEMARKLQSRKAKVECADTDAPPQTATLPSSVNFSAPTISKGKVPPPWKTSSHQDNLQSTLPNPVARDSTPSPLNNPQSNSDLESFKQQIISEMKLEMNKLKEELIEVIRSELSRR